MRKRKCKSCGEYWRPEEETPKWIVWCCEACRLALALKALGKVQKKNKTLLRRSQALQKRDNRRRKREFYENDKKTRREAAVYWFNRYIRLRDAGNGCISCGNNRQDIKYDCGHFITAGSCTALRFNEDNAHSQCVHCNRHLSGNVRLYRAALAAKLGEQTVRFLEGAQPTIKITVDWYREIEEKYKLKCKEME